MLLLIIQISICPITEAFFQDPNRKCFSSSDCRKSDHPSWMGMEQTILPLSIREQAPVMLLDLLKIDITLRLNLSDIIRGYSLPGDNSASLLISNRYLSIKIN